MRAAAAAVCGAVLALCAGPLAFGHGTGADQDGLGPWASLGEVTGTTPAAPGRELARLRTRTSKTFERADGSRVTRVFQRSVHFRAGGGWEPIRNRLEREADGDLTNVANRYELTVPERLGEGPLRVDHDDRWLSFRLEGASDAAASVAGSEATFPAVMPGVSVRWSAQNDAVKEELVLVRRDVPRVYRFDVAGSEGLQVRPRFDGGLEFVDAAGASAFTVLAAFAYDGKGFEAPRGTVRLDARPGGSGWLVELRVDDAWLEDPDTVFPVTVDPTIEVPSEAGDCKLDQELASESFCSVGRLEVGWGAYGAFDHDHRSILKFDVDALLPPGAQVLDAQLHAYLDFRETGAQDKAVRVHRVTSAWTDDASWLERAAGSAWTTPGGDFAPQIEAQTTVGAESTWYAWDVSDLVDGWMSRTIPNQGLVLKDDGSQQDGSFVFASSESGKSFWPYLEIEYQGGAGPGPTHELSGGLRTPLSSDRDLTARAVDDDGVTLVGIWLDPDLDPTNAEAAELVSCAVSCPGELTAQFELPAALSEGRHTMLVRSEDGEGNVTRDRWHFHVADLGEADRSRLGLSSGSSTTAPTRAATRTCT